MYTSKESTQKQLEKFWEKCGFKHNVPFPELSERQDIPNPERFLVEQWYIAGIYCGKIPDLTIDNLFKYAVPKLGLVTVSIYPDKWIEGPTRWCVELKSNSNKFSMFKRVSRIRLELALFWAIWEVLKQEEI